MVQGSLKTIFDFMGPLIIKRSRTTDLNELAFNHRSHFRVNCIYGSYGSSMAANWKTHFDCLLPQHIIGTNRWSKDMKDCNKPVLKYCWDAFIHKTFKKYWVRQIGDKNISLFHYINKKLIKEVLNKNSWVRTVVRFLKDLF